MVRYGLVWYGKVSMNKRILFQSLYVKYGMVWYGMVRYGNMRKGIEAQTKVIVGGKWSPMDNLVFWQACCLWVLEVYESEKQVLWEF